MLFDAEIINLILYCLQQLGIALGLGAQTIMLVAFASAMRDGVIDNTEARFLRATRNTLWVSLALVAVSGIAITMLHVLAGQGATILTPAYLFKSLLIAVVLVLTATLHMLPETFAEGLLGGTWYALFLVHILAPVTTWINLFILYVVWMVGFNLIWYVIAFSTRQKKKIAEPTPSSELAILKKSIPIVQVPKVLKPIEVQVPIAPVPPPTLPPTPVQQIKIDPAPIAPQSTIPIEKMPASKTTDTPFLPQVPPLQPIPTIPPTPGVVPQPLQVAPMLQKPEELPVTAPTVSPEIKLGLNVMPKSPGQMGA